jgi:hypothetical protein
LGNSGSYRANILIAPLIYLTQPEIRLPKYALLFWVFIPVLIFSLAFILDLFVQPDILSSNTIILFNFLSGGGEFRLNLYFLVWAVRYFQNPSTE